MLFFRKLILVFALFAVGYAGLAREAALEMPIGMAKRSDKGVEEIQSDIDFLNALIPSFPARFSSKGERQKTYKRWKGALLSARRYAEEHGESEQSFVLLAELYRLGHNMQVAETTDHAREEIDKGLERFPESVALWFSSAYFLLSLDARFSPQAEKALMKLRSLKQSDRDYDVERGFVFLYLNNFEMGRAIEQIDKCLEINEGDEMMIALKRGLQGGLKRKEARSR